MKAAVIYYSFTGNTKKIAEKLKEKLSLRFEVDFIPLEVVKEEKRFFFQAKQAFFKQKIRLKDVSFDLSPYRLICLGSPVWAFQPAPAIRSFLKKVSTFAGKKIILFFTFGSGLGVEKCLKTTTGLLSKKGGIVVKTFTYPQKDIGDTRKIEAKIEDLIKDIE